MPPGNGIEGGPLKLALSEATESAPAEQKIPEVELFLFRLAADRFAVESTLVFEVLRLPPLSALPGAPPFLQGVAAHRGEVLPVVDLNRFMGRAESKRTERSRIAVARVSGMVVGLLADDVLGLATIGAAAIQPPPVGGDGGAELLSGVATDSKGIVSILDLRRMLASARARSIGA